MGKTHPFAVPTSLLHLVDHQFKLPKFDTLVRTSARNPAKIWAHRDGPSFALVGGDLFQQTPSCNVKNLELARLGGDDHVAITRCEENRQSVIARHRSDAILRASIPNFQGFTTGRCQGDLV